MNWEAILAAELRHADKLAELAAARLDLLRRFTPPASDVAAEPPAPGPPLPHAAAPAATTEDFHLRPGDEYDEAAEVDEATATDQTVLYRQELRDHQIGAPGFVDHSHNFQTVRLQSGAVFHFSQNGAEWIHAIWQWDRRRRPSSPEFTSETITAQFPALPGAKQTIAACLRGRAGWTAAQDGSKLAVIGTLLEQLPRPSTTGATYRARWNWEARA